VKLKGKEPNELVVSKTVGFHRNIKNEIRFPGGNGGGAKCDRAFRRNGVEAKCRSNGSRGHAEGKT
jgi:hypothetical protein